ncbi:DUF3574 domain-containing protein [Sphingopyxis flava]|uniref:DUF3574 domain-containing protein n=1 Tax=Sphingopyxis flava TaxID=1507287 RepID=A0A1T5BRM0_9SPHN|nr:DUF3574 domain-containing protein [Sphingopyxis flava]SKB49918.1 Protein of unknown function [Sphingopyxis flava]
MEYTHISRIYFGMAIPSGGAVSKEDWAAFEAENIAAYFPDGYTVLPAEGAWRDTDTGQTIHEPTIVVEVAHDGSAQTQAAIRIVATIYKTLFHQQAVMVQTARAEVGFI